ncbi:MAG: hypothetical protein JO228_15240, partial [Xanthobacteraceae bacterium]|nr:hypothetical protein [Xanthobacteraceae bacterium]
MAPYVIFFRGLAGLIDEAAAARLAKNRGSTAVFYRYDDWREAVQHVAAHPEAPYHVVGFSRGAAPDVMGGFMREARKRGLRLPEDLMTVGLYGGTRRYADPHFACVNFLDSSGRQHVGERNAVDLGAHVPHLGPGSGMERVADMFADGKNPLTPIEIVSAAAKLDRAAPTSSSGVAERTDLPASSSGRAVMPIYAAFFMGQGGYAFSMPFV